MTVGARGCNKLAIAGFWRRFAADRDPPIAGGVAVPDEVLVKELVLALAALASKEGDGGVLAATGAAVVDANAWTVDDGLRAIPWLITGVPAVVLICGEVTGPAVFGFVTRDCAVGGNGIGVTVDISGRFVSLR